MRKNKRIDWDGFNSLIDEVVRQIHASKKTYKWVISLNRGGCIPGVVISHRLNANHGVFTVQSYNGKEKMKEVKHDLYISMLGQIHPSDRILIVDDILDSGDSLKAVMKKIPKIDSDIKNIDTAVLCYKPKSSVTPTYYGEEVSGHTWVSFPWESDNQDEHRK